MSLPVIRCVIALLIALLIWPATALANDSTAALSAGGLRLEKSDQIAILSEKLRIGPKRIVVDYEMQTPLRSRSIRSSHSPCRCLKAQSWQTCR